MVLGHVPIDLPKGISPHLATKRSSIFNVRISRFERVPFGRNLPRSDCRGAFFPTASSGKKSACLKPHNAPMLGGVSKWMGTVGELCKSCFLAPVN